MSENKELAGFIRHRGGRKITLPSGEVIETKIQVKDLKSFIVGYLVGHRKTIDDIWGPGYVPLARRLKTKRLTED